jgi:hypothetical protein
MRQRGVTAVVRSGGTFLVLACAIFFVISSIHWPLVDDASLMHYVAFLMDRGMIPYRDIIDVNMPGTYCVEWLEMHVFGNGALAWRLYDVVLGCAALSAMVLVAWPVDRLAGFFAGGAFFLIHGRDGIAELGQRDLLLAVTLLWSAAFLMSALRQKNLHLLALGSAVAGFGATVKPTAAVFWFVMLLCTVIRKSDLPWKLWPFLLAGSCPFFLVPSAAAFALYDEHALSAFERVATGLIPYHNTLFRVPSSYFLTHLIPSSLLPLSLIAMIILCLRFREKRAIFSRYELLLVAGVCCGVLSFAIQGKAYSYHRYPMDAFLILLVSLVIFEAADNAQSSMLLPVIGMLGIIAGAVILAPQCLVHASRLSSSPNDFSNLLQRDLNALGGHALDGDVQCIDFTGGCITTLYRMHLEQSTGFLYDCYAYGPSNSRFVRDYREAFRKALVAHPPSVLVVSSQNCEASDNFDKIDRWADLGSLIRSQYVFDKEVIPPDAILWAGQPALSPKYRIYLHRSY